MKLKVLDQILISSVQSDTLRPNEQIEVSDELGATLLERHPAVFEQVAEAKDAPAPANKMAKSPKNKGAR